MKEKTGQRFDDLVAQGEKLISETPRDGNGPQTFIPDERLPEYQSWVSSAANLLRVVCPRDSHYVDQCKRVEEGMPAGAGVLSSVFLKMLGVLRSAREEWAAGMLTRIEYIVAAATFDDFLDHAADYHKANKKIEASVLASAVLEDTVKKIALKNSVNEKRSLDPIIDDLAAVGVFTPVKAKRVKAYAGTRNKADHAEWDAFDIKDVGEMINGVRELIEEFL
ncbi:MAG: hypothetical protein Q8Q12_12010 [bacterium]|nr:hypothetical protein [bacterium]